MSEKSGFSDKQQPDPDVSNAAEAAFQAEREFRPASSNDQRFDTRFQSLSPDKPVLEARNLDKLPAEQVQQLQRTLGQVSEQWSKVSGPLRNAYNTHERNKISGTENGEWMNNYSGKVLGVLRENTDELTGKMPIRIAFPVQSFAPGPGGQVKGETLYAFFPPLQTDIQERYITFPLHSTDPSREAQLRKQGLSLATSCSSDELVFHCKRATVHNETLLPRRQRGDA